VNAGFWIRFGASLLDGIIINIPLFIVAHVLVGAENRDLLGNLLYLLYGLIVPVVWGGYNVGKKICGIRIRKVDDEMPPTIGTMLLRQVVGSLVYAVTLGIGLIVSAIMVAVRDDKRAIHDFIAGTEVVRD